MLSLSGIELITPRQVIQDATLTMDGGRIIHAGHLGGASLPPEAHSLHLPGRRVLPGFIDVHMHGLLGKDAFGEELADVIRLLPRYGVSAFLATTVTMPMESVLNRLQAMRHVLEHPPSGATCLGIHMEGNFLSPQRTGMANPDWCQALEPGIFETLQEASGGAIRMITFAPEAGDAMDMIPYLLDHGVIPSIGHSDASYEQAMHAVERGVTHATHTFNAMSPLHHRSPGVVGAVLNSNAVTAELIADGHHVHPGVMRLLLNVKGANGVCLVSDSSPVAGLPDGTYPWEGYTMVVKDGTCRLPDGRLAGALALLDTGFHTLITSLGLLPTEAAVCTGEVPAGVLGLSGRKGQLLPGCDADFVVMDSDWQVEVTGVAGEIVYQREV